MKKSIIATSLVALLAPLAMQTAVLADDTTTNASVEINEGKLPNHRVDPTKPATWDNGTDKDNKGNFSLMQVPKTFSFGSIEVQSNNKEQKVQSFGKPEQVTDNTGNQVMVPDEQVQVGDLRGTGAGWTLSAQLGELRNGDKTLTSRVAKDTTPAKITFSDLGNQADGIHGLYNTVLNGSGKKIGPNWLAPTSDNKDTIELLAGHDTSTGIIKPGVKAGMGITTLRFDQSNVTLTIPAAQQLVGTYTGFITWTLTPGTIPNTLIQTSKTVK